MNTFLSFWCNLKCRGVLLRLGMLCLINIAASTAALAQLPLGEACIPSGSPIMEPCNCQDYFGRPATRQCRQSVSTATGSATGRSGKTCPVLCDACQCSSSSSSTGSSSGYLLGQGSPPSNGIRFCSSQFKGDCTSGMPWEPCLSAAYGAPEVANKMCQARGKPGGTWTVISNEPGQRCGHTVYEVTCH